MTDPAAPAPYTHHIQVGWGDCDPARIAYTARLPWFALEAINGWWADALGEQAGWYHMELDRGTGTPFVSMSMDFRAPVTPRHKLLCACWPTRLGTTSVSFRVEGRQDGTLCFEGDFTCVFIDSPSFTKKPPPEDIRALVEARIP
ncbi:acyl-CoA thioesterase [Vannielia sp.]|uniref:acyl-CoA thioesterase n=1 Tax=Vannielia sp. TaxID=2813045 RepID=UPI003BAD46FF